MSYAPDEPSFVTPVQQRPTAGIVFGALNLGFAAFGAIGLLMTAMMFFAPKPNDPNPVLSIMAENQTYRIASQVSTVLGMPSLALMAASGFGLLNMKPYGRSLALAYGVYGIFMALVGAVINFAILFPALLDKLHNLPAGRDRAAMMGGIIGGMFGGAAGVVIPLIYCGLLLFFMTRPHIVAAYAPADDSK